MSEILSDVFYIPNNIIMGKTYAKEWFYVLYIDRDDLDSLGFIPDRISDQTMEQLAQTLQQNYVDS